MAEYKLVIGLKNGKCVQKEVKSPEADAFSKKSIGETVKGEDCGMPGYEFLITGGSDKCGFPMRKGVQFHRKKVMIGQGVGFSGKTRTKKTQKGLEKRRTVCGERVTSIIRQVNLKATKEGPTSLEAAKAEAKPEQ
ncbi:MAG: 30S ribosomal protein S6e [Nanoarchaeota archaeon]|nr:30S ribosomal protein S6e [Nanoarchaeota archaeon]MBU1623310.1 30S ribosomal protein S6e [Nanoarchaeota archaeon]MBU1974558.1 30S ribosomal protein S6e [Nanoarchaeota archaeon]